MTNPKVNFSPEDLRRAVEEKYGVRHGYLKRAAQDLGVNYSQISNFLAGSARPTSKFLEALGLIPKMPQFKTKDGFTGVVLVVAASPEVKDHLNYLRAYPGERFTAHENHYLSQCLEAGLIKIREHFKNNPAPDWCRNADADVRAAQVQATETVPTLDEDRDGYEQHMALIENGDETDPLA